MQRSSEGNGSAIAVIGMAGRFPGANGVEELWKNLREGVESVAEISLEEWAKEIGVHPSFIDRPDMVRFKPQIEGAEMFDAAFFGYTPREAQILDPQQRLFLECAWEALEDAGYDSARYPGAIGVAAGVSQSSYLLNYLQWDKDLGQSMGALKIGLGNMNDAFATRVAYKLDLKGAAYAVQSFCSTSLVAVHLGCQSLLNHENDMVLAGGATISVSQQVGYQYQEGGILSPDGKTRTFDAKSRGMVFGNGLGCVVLKRLKDALRDGDNVRAVLLGTAVNNDGALKVGFTAPSVQGQAEVIVEALSAAGIDPDTIGYVEAHGTATALGDPAEIAGLTKAWRNWTDRRQFCGIGSVKTNIGHLDAAAGVAGLIKTVLSLEREEIPASLHYETPNPQIDFAASPFHVVTSLTRWPRRQGAPRRAALSAFGIGGTNAHAVLEEAPLGPEPEAARPWQLLVLSAKTVTALDQATANLARHLTEHPLAHLGDAAFTLQVGRRIFNHRRFVVARDQQDAAARLADPKAVEGGVGDRQQAPVAFMFSGQGSQYVGMGRELYADEPAFREALDRCADVLRGPLGADLREVMYAKEDDPEAAERLQQTSFTQPALFAFEYALSQLWASLGIEPVAMIGHSVGEYVAACLAGVFSLEDALLLIAERGRLMQSMPPGAMLAVPLAEAALRPLLREGIDLASLNAPAASVVAGPAEAVAAVEADLLARGIVTRRLHTSHAFHSAMMDPIVPAFVERVAATARHAPRIPFVSNVTGRFISAEEAQDPAYWGRHLRQAVRFADGVGALRGKGNPILLEIGPGNTLSSLAKQGPAAADAAPAIASVRHPREQTSDRAFLLTALGRLWLGGAALDGRKVHGERRRRVSLPRYPFERQRYWVEPNEMAREGSDVSRGLSFRRQEVEDWFYQMSWRRNLPAEVAVGPRFKDPQDFCIFTDELGLGARLAEELRRDGQMTVLVRQGSAFARRSATEYEVRPGERSDYEALLAALGKVPSQVLHLWGFTEADPRALGARLAGGHERGFLSLLFLAQAIARRESKPHLQLAVVTNGMQDVAGGDLAFPEKATAIGPCRVVPQEFPGISCRSIDLAPEGALLDPRLARWILAEITSDQPDRMVAYRGGHRWVQTAEPTPLPAVREGLPLRKHGVYLVTGGLGGIGLALARHLAQEWKAKLVLTGRSSLPPREQWAGFAPTNGDGGVRERMDLVRDLEARGAEVLYIAADVSCRDDMEVALQKARAKFGPFSGVVHSAGVAGGGIIPLKDKEAAARVLGPKVAGTVVLDELLADDPLDFVFLCSSAAALLGGFGQVDYCAANAFLDAYAHHARARGRQVISVNWDAWKDVGMAVNTQASGFLQAVRAWNLKLGIGTDEGIDAFLRVLASGLPQVVAVTMDMRPMLAREKLRRREVKVEEEALSPAPAQEEGAEASVPVGGDVERLIARAWAKVLGRGDIGADDNFFELGGDSLTALQAIAVMKSLLGREVPIVTFYEAPTVALLAKALAPKLEEEKADRGDALEESGKRADTRRELLEQRRRQRGGALASRSVVEEP